MATWRHRRASAPLRVAASSAFHVLDSSPLLLECVRDFLLFLRTESVKMRPAFAVALALSLALAAVRANETPQPISNFMAEPSVAEPSLAASDNETADGLVEREAPVVTSRSATDETNAAPNDSKVCVMLRAESFEIKTGNKSPRAVSIEPAAFLFCMRYRISISISVWAFFDVE